MTREYAVTREVYPGEFLPKTRNEKGERFTLASARENARSWTRRNAGRLAIVDVLENGAGVAHIFYRAGRITDKQGRLA